MLSEYQLPREVHPSVLRDKYGMSIRVISLELGVTEGAVQRWFFKPGSAGRREPSTSIKILSAYLEDEIKKKLVADEVMTEVT